MMDKETFFKDLKDELDRIIAENRKNNFNDYFLIDGDRWYVPEIISRLKTYAGMD
jgi:hypothetical protein